MEHYGPDARRPAEKVQDDVAACDIYVCIVAWRYGYIPKDSEYSITELEYRKAVEQKLPMWAFLLADDVPCLPKNMDGGETGHRRIDKFRDELMTQHIVTSSGE